MKKAKRVTPIAKVRKAITSIICIVLIIVIFCCVAKSVTAKFGVEGVLDFVDSAIEGAFKSKDATAEVYELKQKAGGIIKGVCHPAQCSSKEYMDGANIGWVRIDCDRSFDIYNEDGSYDSMFESTLNSLKYHMSQGSKVLLIYSASMRDAYYLHGYDIRTEEGTKQIKRCAKEFILAVRDYVGAVQVANECDIARFSAPFTIEECAKFIGVIMEAVNEYKGNVIVGYNGTPINIIKLTECLQPWMQYCDWVGIDEYLGCFEPVTKVLSLLEGVLFSVWNATHKPIIITEFGYMSRGEPKTKAEKEAILKEYGFDSISDAKKNIWKLVEQLPKNLQYNIYSGVISYSSDEELADALFSGENEKHLFRVLQDSYYVIGYPHNPDGQAKLLADSIEIFKKYDFVCGAFIFSMVDAGGCYYCGFEDCPLETSWGIVNADGTPKPAYYAVRDAFADWN